ncbi:sel1 repeat family protein [Helicobacter sp. MIT 14-3879]|uniref:sel1 repeat family protein n=1 Tax=Helicobacter sp. MIT 14-3879 TaxID=2040649 RepID=UPI000E1F7703|nr:sel1 repeat family protein [Helicobacter sp. MIT 14-3879]RDU61202.1 hypothetical protein CQA44_09780 [Helicobacter sp. MIT 14-3879]
MKTLEIFKKAIYPFLLGIFLICFVTACATKDEAKLNEDKISINKMIALHEDMNKKHGLTTSYSANIAVANDEYDKAYKLYYNECRNGSTIDCLNAYYIGEERALEEYNSQIFARQLAISVKQSLKACKSNVSLGCVNVFFAFEALDDNDEFITNAISPVLEGVNDERIVDKTLNLTKKECKNDDATSCFYRARVLRVIDNYADVEYYIDKGLELGYAIAPFVRLPSQSLQNIGYFKRSCALNEALSCRYVAHWLDKYENDYTRAKEFYQKACKLGLESACVESSKGKAQVDELGSPVIKRR